MAGVGGYPTAIAGGVPLNGGARGKHWQRVGVVLFEPFEKKQLPEADCSLQMPKQ